MDNISGKNLFFLGKGGAGKTTLASMTALALAEREMKVVLFSLDPAHNLYDIFQIKSTKPVLKLQDNLILEEIDIDYWIKTYLKSIENKISRSYKHLTALSLEKHFETIRFSPGLEEYALLYAFEKVIKTYNDYDIRIFDLPPTALALRFFNLSKLTVVWLEQLIDLRKEILKKKKIISDVYQRPTEEVKDNLLKQLIIMHRSNQETLENFQNKVHTGVYIISNEDELSQAESIDIIEKMRINGFHIDGILVNKYQNHENKLKFQKTFRNTDLHFIDHATNPLIGMNKLHDFSRISSMQSYIDSIQIPDL